MPAVSLQAGSQPHAVASLHAHQDAQLLSQYVRLRTLQDETESLNV